MKIDAYLERIGYNGPLDPTVETLKQLHRAHVLSVPFENLDVHLGNPIVVSLPLFYDKIVQRQRGGFCYELNALFGWLLDQLGFKVTRLSGRVFKGAGIEPIPGELGPEFDHLLLMVEIGERLIADVGFGSMFLEPLWLDTNEKNVQGITAYRITGSDFEKLLQRSRESSWEKLCTFSLIPRKLSEFSEMCHYHQTSSEAFCTQKALCTLPTANGRVTLSTNRLIVTTGDQREERKIQSEEEYRMLLKSYFGIDIGKNERIDRLMSPNTFSS